MNHKEFRQTAHQMVDWMADYMESIEEQRIVPTTKPREILNLLPLTAPLQGESFDAIWKDFLDWIVPNMTHWNHPGWFAYFPANNSPASVLAEMLMATMGAQCMSWQTSPAATELEIRVIDWLRQLFLLPDSFVGCIQDTASTSTFVAILSAREKALQRQENLALTQMTIYASSQTHSSLDKAIKMAGIPLSNLRKIPVRSDFSVCVASLQRTLQEDTKQGYTPICLLGTVGTTSTCAVDSLQDLFPLAKAYGMWFHVDMAFAGAAAILPEKRALFDGMEKADSIVFNPHKWLFTNFDCSAYFVQDPLHLEATLQTNPDYLKTKYDQEVINFRDWSPQLGRRFRALKLWFVLRDFGVDGLQHVLRKHLQLAQEFSQWIQEEEQLELFAPVAFSLVCFRWIPQKDLSLDELNQYNRKLLEAINQDPFLHCTSSTHDNQWFIRVSIGQLQTESKHLLHLWTTLQQAMLSIQNES